MKEMSQFSSNMGGFLPFEATKPDKFSEMILYHHKVFLYYTVMISLGIVHKTYEIYLDSISERTTYKRGPQDIINGIEKVLTIFRNRDSNEALELQLVALLAS